MNQADQACARERAERIREMEDILHGKVDPYKEHTKDAILKVQEQMLVNIFHGKRVCMTWFGFYLHVSSQMSCLSRKA